MIIDEKINEDFILDKTIKKSLKESEYSDSEKLLIEEEFFYDVFYKKYIKNSHNKSAYEKMLSFSQKAFFIFIEVLMEKDINQKHIKFVYDFINNFLEEYLNIIDKINNEIEEIEKSKETLTENLRELKRLKEIFSNNLETPLSIFYKDEIKEKLLDQINNTRKKDDVYNDPYSSITELYRNKEIGFGFYHLTTAILSTKMLFSEEFENEKICTLLSNYLYPLKDENLSKQEVISNNIKFFKNYFSNKMEQYKVRNQNEEEDEFINAFIFLNSLNMMEESLKSGATYELKQSLNSWDFFEDIYNKYPQLVTNKKVKNYLLYTNDKLAHEYNLLINMEQRFPGYELAQNLRENFAKINTTPLNIQDIKVSYFDHVIRVSYNVSEKDKELNLDKVIPYLIKKKLDNNDLDFNIFMDEINQICREKLLKLKLENNELHKKEEKNKRKI